MTGVLPYLQSARSLAEDVSAELGFELYDIKTNNHNGRTTIQIFIDADGGIKLDDCEAFSKKLSLRLDIEDIFRTPYVLEVSSPGIFKELITDNHLRRHTGARVEVKYGTEGVSGTQKLLGTLTSFDTENLYIVKETGGGLINIARNAVKKISLAPKL